MTKTVTKPTQADIDSARLAGFFTLNERNVAFWWSHKDWPTRANKCERCWPAKAMAEEAMARAHLLELAA